MNLPFSRLTITSMFFNLKTDYFFFKRTISIILVLYLNINSIFIHFNYFIEIKSI